MTRLHVNVFITVRLAAALILNSLPVPANADSLGADREARAPEVPGAASEDHASLASSVFLGAPYAPVPGIEISSFEVPGVIATTSGKRPYMPTCVPVHWPDRNTSMGPVAWDVLPDDSYMSGMGTSPTVYGALTCRGSNIWRRVLQDRDRGTRQGLRQRRARGGRVRGGGARSAHVCHG